MAPDGENFRGINAARLLSTQDNFTIDKTIAAGYDTKLTAFEVLVPALVKTFENNVQQHDSLYMQLLAPVTILKNWDYRCAENSVATTLAIEWADKLNNAIQKVYVNIGEADQVQKTKQFAATAAATDLLLPLHTVLVELTQKFGSWKIEWGRINRFQRISSDINQTFNDADESVPVAFCSSAWGMLPSYISRYFSGTSKRYGVHGNSFVCAVQFGKTVKAKSLLAGGVSGNAASKHFTDQALMYTKGTFKQVSFYKKDVLKNAVRSYNLGY